MAQDDEKDLMITVCAGPPLCLLQDMTAVAAANAGCELCKRIVVHPDGSETVLQTTVN